MNRTIILCLTLSFSTTLLALNPSRTYKQKPEKYNMKYEEVKVTSSDGAELNVWEFPAKKTSTKTILISHNGEGNMADYLRRVDHFVSTMNVVIYDYRGFGESSEFEIDNNMYIYPQFQEDMKAMMAHCVKKEEELYLYGWGIGAGLSLGIGWRQPDVTKIIADTPFLSMEDLEVKFAGMDEPMEVPMAGFDKKNEPVNAVASSAGYKTLKVLLIIGESDALMSSDDMSGLQKVGKKNIDKEIFVIENPDRKDNFRVDKAAYMKRINEFLTQ